jgi:hypothetical protein
LEERCCLETATSACGAGLVRPAEAVARWRRVRPARANPTGLAPQAETTASWRRRALIAHIVLFRPRADLSAQDAAALVDAFERALNEIPFIRRARVGKRITIGRDYERLMSIDYEYAAVLEFDDVAGLKGYLEHGAHDDVGSRFFDSIEAALVYDFEVRNGADGLADLAGRRGGV